MLLLCKQPGSASGWRGSLSLGFVGLTSQRFLGEHTFPGGSCGSLRSPSDSRSSQMSVRGCRSGWLCDLVRPGVAFAVKVDVVPGRANGELCGDHGSALAFELGAYFCGTTG